MKVLRSFISLFLLTGYTMAEYSYPELSVTPRATERVKMLAEKEKSNTFFTDLPMQVSALSTLTSGALMLGNTDEVDDENKYAAKTAITVGLAWTGINYYIAKRANFYANSVAEFNKLPSKNARQRLIRERVAEEGLYSTAKLVRKLKWLSVLTNAGANAYMLANTEKDSTSEITNVVSLAAAFGPLLFKSHWEKQRKIHQRYKRKIYGPIITSSLFRVNKDKVLPGVLFSMNF